jgi:hypothetical protein
MEQGFGHTAFHPATLALTLAMGAAFFLVRRERAMLPLLVVAVLVPHLHRIVIGGLDFSMVRIVLLFGWARVLSRGETRGYRWHPADTAILVWLGFSTFAYMVGPRASFSNFVNRLGLISDVAGSWFLLRVLLRTPRALQTSIAGMAGMALLLVGPMLVEHLTGRNLFSVLGGVSERTIVRDGRLRCQGAFSHPIMAGNFGASIAPLFLAMWLGLPRERIRYTAAFAAATAVTIFSSSSGPLIAYLSAVVGWALWPLRRHMSAIRWGTLAALVVLHFVREKPVWHLIGRLSSITGGTGYHRYALIDAAVNHFGEWWLLGIESTSHWTQYHATDITNQYILEGVRGGLATLLAFVALLVIAFRSVGRSLAHARALDANAAERRRLAWLAWGLGVALASHAVAFIAVSYFGQLQNILFMQLAMIPCLEVALARQRATDAARAREREPAPALAPATAG